MTKRLIEVDDDKLAQVLDMGEPGGILVAAHLVAEQMRRMVDEPEARREIQDSLLDVFDDQTIA